MLSQKIFMKCLLSQHIQIDLLNEMRKYINWGYDEETDEEFDFPFHQKDVDLSQFEKFPDTRNLLQ